MASMMHLPTYVTDDEIKSKLDDVGAELLSPIKRRYVEIEDTKYADGTRFCKVRLSQYKSSLPFTMKFSDGESEGYYMVIHDGQCKTCSVCGSNEHLKKQCPSFVCYQCGVQGHIKRFCTTQRCANCMCYKCEGEQREREKASLCDKCGHQAPHYCICRDENEVDDDMRDVDDEDAIQDDNDDDEDIDDDFVDDEDNVQNVDEEINYNQEDETVNISKIQMKPKHEKL